MYIYKDNKFSSEEKISYSLSLKECQNNINILESLVEYIKNIENSLKEIMQQNINLKNQMQINQENVNINLEKENELILKIFAQGRAHIENVEKIINNFKNLINRETPEFICDGNGENKNIDNNSKNKVEITNEIKEIKNYYEGKIDIMEKKIKIFEVLEDLYEKQIDGLKKELKKSDKLKSMDD